jgi:hypothetical protein
VCASLDDGPLPAGAFKPHAVQTSRFWTEHPRFGAHFILVEAGSEEWRAVLGNAHGAFDDQQERFQRAHGWTTLSRQRQIVIASH